MADAKRRRPRAPRAAVLAALAVAAVVCRLLPATDAAGPRSYRVVDADTVVVRGVTIRLLGIDAPEAGQTCTRKMGWWGRREWPCGDAATAALRAFLRGRALTCVGASKDRYGRTLARCAASGGFGQRVDVGAWLLARGLAVTYMNPPKAYLAVEKAARKARVGMWGGSFVRPDKWRARRATAARAKKEKMKKRGRR